VYLPKGRKKPGQMLKRVQHDNGFGPLLLSSRTCFGISVFGLGNLGFKALPLWCGFFIQIYHNISLEQHLLKGNLHCSAIKNTYFIPKEYRVLRINFIDPFDIIKELLS
jgi:hypothetical protein